MSESAACGANPKAPPPASAEAGQPVAAALCLRHCFAFRLRGSETQEQTLALMNFGSAALIVAIERVRVYLCGAAAAPAGAIGAVQAHAALCGGRVVCTAQVSDFPDGDLVVVEVDVAVCALG